MKNSFKLLPILLFIFSVFAAPNLVASAATLSVNVNDPACSDVTGTPFCTIQAAIAAASANDTITVAPGTYYEVGQIIIDKDLTITGVSRDTVIIKPDHDTSTASYTLTSGWFYVTPGTTFTMSGVTLDGTDLGGVNRTIHTAVQSRGNSIISDCKVKNIRSHKYIGIGIQFLDGANNSVTNCEFSNIQRIGIHVRGGVLAANPTATLTDITYTGKGNGDWLDYGIEFGGGGSGNVYNATISGNTGVAASDGSTSAGILATDYFGNGTTAGIYNSTITGNTTGIYVGYLPTDNTVVTASNNNLSGNLLYGISNVGQVMTNAEYNWWGDSSGPYDPLGTFEVDGSNCTSTPVSELNADGTGVEVSNTVDYCPWLGAQPVPPTVTNVNSAQDTGDGILAEGEIASVSITQLLVTFSEDMDNRTAGDEVTNPQNYRLISEGSQPGIDTFSCAATSQGDLEVAISSISYDSTSFTATLSLAASLPEGEYRLLACGSTTLRDLTGVPLNDGEDFIRNFEVRFEQTKPPSSTLPSTGFAKGAVSSLPVQPIEKMYQSTDLVLQIPTLDQEMKIVGVPNSSSGWDVSWLGDDAGYLDGSAFPTWEGNTVLSAHVWDANNNPGPFAELKDLRFGDRFYIQAYGLTYTYEVRENKIVWPSQVTKVFQHEEYDWVTLLTCEFFNPFTDEYLFRRMVRGVLVSID